MKMLAQFEHKVKLQLVTNNIMKTN